MWLAILEKLNTKELLWKKGLLNEDQIRCTFYSDQAENFNHVLMACSVSWNIWCTMAKDLNQALSMPDTFRKHYEDWMGRKWRNVVMKKLWCSTFFAVAWSLWLMRNEIIFQQKQLDVQVLCSLIRWRVALWTKAWKDQLPYSVNDLARKFDAIPVLFP